MEEVRRPDPQSQGPWEFSVTFSPTSQSVYFTCLFNIYMNQGNIISQKQKTWLPLFKHLDKEGRKPSSGFGWLKKKEYAVITLLSVAQNQADWRNWMRLPSGSHLGTSLEEVMAPAQIQADKSPARAGNKAVLWFFLEYEVPGNLKTF